MTPTILAVKGGIMTAKERLFRLIEAMSQEEAARLFEEYASEREKEDEEFYFEKVIDRLMGELTREELSQLPTDLSQNLDHYAF